jgi:pyridoxal phosphate enzyme (YggS family)
MSIPQNIAELRSMIPQNVSLVAISKTRSKDEIMEAYNSGQRDFGENRAQEMTSKAAGLPSDIRWHLVGHLQTNKVKTVAPFVHLIHSVDSPKLLSEINKEAVKNNRIIKCLLQFYIASEETKFGLSLQEGIQILESPEYKAMLNIQIAGVMGMASFTEDQAKVRSEFKELFHIFTLLKNRFFINSEHFKEISMGMSGDYELAIEAGSTMVRLGTIIFGKRN